MLSKNFAILIVFLSLISFVNGQQEGRIITLYFSSEAQGIYCRILGDETQVLVDRRQPTLDVYGGKTPQSLLDAIDVNFASGINKKDFSDTQGFYPGYLYSRGGDKLDIGTPGMGISSEVFKFMGTCDPTNYFKTTVRALPREQETGDDELPLAKLDLKDPKYSFIFEAVESLGFPVAIYEEVSKSLTGQYGRSFFVEVSAQQYKIDLK
jgi:hypothetical protein